MARVVQRSTPPYLTIVFVFLFFIAAAAAAWFYNGWHSTEKQLIQKTDTLNALASGLQQSDDTMAAQKATARRKGLTVVGLYRADQQGLIKAITGKTDPTVAQALATADSLYGDRVDELSANGLAGYVARLKLDLDAAQKAVARLRNDFLQANTQLAAERKAAADAQAAMAEQRRQVGEQLAAATRRADDLAAKYDAAVRRAANQWNDRVAEQETMLSDKDGEIRKLEKSVREKDIRITQLQAKLNESTPEAKTDLRADGLIIKVAGEDVVYIDLGSKQRVRIGLPFSVYSKRTGVGAELPVKAKIIVTNVFDRLAECRVLESTATDPIVENDLVSNIAFNAAAKPTFVVEGDFDINADGEIDRQSNEKVRAMIQRYGGAVVDAIDVNVDYVVMGQVPVRKARPGADAAPSDLALWEKTEQAATRYHTVKADAIKLSKPVLNTNQFLTFIGYAPEVTAN